MTNDLQRLLGEIAAGQDARLGDVAHLKRLLFIAESCASDADCGGLLLNVCDGDWDEFKTYIAALDRITESIFKRWILGARLTYLEKQGSKTK